MTPAARALRREEDLRDVVMPRLARVAEVRPKIRSALFVVSQYWDDNADDEVHGAIVFSIHDAPAWPHQCARGRPPDDDFCTRCSRDPRHGGYFSLPYTEASFRAWETYCREDSHQDDPLHDAYLPYAAFRRRADGDWERTAVVPPLRGWLELEPATKTGEHYRDAPALDPLYAAPESIGTRAVVADALLEREDPRGELIARQIGNAGATELLSTHQHEWLGPLASVVPLGGAIFTNGFPEELSVYFDENAEAGTFDAILSAREWLTVRRLRFLPGSQHHLSSQMCNVRQVGPLDEHLILSFGDARVRWCVERMQIRMSDGTVAEVLSELLRKRTLPNLRELVVHGEGATPENLVPLFELGIRAIDVARAEPWGRNERMAFDPNVAGRWLDALRDPNVRVSFGSLGARGEPAGPWAELRFEGAALTHTTSWRGWDSRVTETDLIRAIDAIVRS